MTSMKVRDLMSTDVVAVAPETSLKEVAELLVEHGIGGVPVCDRDGSVLGVVSESDIIWKELRMDAESGGLLGRLLDRAYGDHERARAQTAREAMSSPAVTIEPDASVSAAGRLMVSHLVNRLPVVTDGRLLGILARSDLVRAFQRPDDAIEREIREDVLLELLCVDPDRVWLMVMKGEVVIGGEVENHSTARSIERCIGSIPGVTSVRSELRWQIDDRSHRTTAAATRLERKV
jgi:CBS domain-containing protein